MQNLILLSRSLPKNLHTSKSTEVTVVTNLN